MERQSGGRESTGGIFSASLPLMAVSPGTSSISNVLRNREVHQEQKHKLIQPTGVGNEGDDPHPKQQGIWAMPCAQLLCSSCLWQMQADLAWAHFPQSCSRDPFPLCCLGRVTSSCSTSFPKFKCMVLLLSPFMPVFSFPPDSGFLVEDQRSGLQSASTCHRFNCTIQWFFFAGVLSRNILLFFLYYPLSVQLNFKSGAWIPQDSHRTWKIMKNVWYIWKARWISISPYLLCIKSWKIPGRTLKIKPEFTLFLSHTG